jgi:hypothetical protein
MSYFNYSFAKALVPYHGKEVGLFNLPLGFNSGIKGWPDNLKIINYNRVEVIVVTGDYIVIHIGDNLSNFYMQLYLDVNNTLTWQSYFNCAYKDNNLEKKLRELYFLGLYEVKCG